MANEVAVTNEVKFDLALGNASANNEFFDDYADEAATSTARPEYGKVKVPSGGGLAFTIQRDENNEDVAKEIECVVAFAQSSNCYWKEKFTGENLEPDCASSDSLIGYRKGTDAPIDCRKCPLNQFGSGEGGVGKACKNMKRLFLLVPGESDPFVLTLPPTSLKNWDQYSLNLANKQKLRYFQVVTKITLKKEESSGGIKYSKCVFTQAGNLSLEQSREVHALNKELKEAFKNSVPTAGDLEAKEVKTSADGFIEVAGGEELPFE